MDSKEILKEKKFNKGKRKQETNNKKTTKIINDKKTKDNEQSVNH